MQTLSRLGAHAQLVHKALHDRKAHTAALAAAGRIQRLHGLLHVFDAFSEILDHDLQRVSAEDPQAHDDAPYRIRIGMDDCVCHRFGYSRFDIAELFKRRVELGGKGRHGRACEKLVAAFAREFKFDVILLFHLFLLSAVYRDGDQSVDTGGLQHFSCLVSRVFHAKPPAVAPHFPARVDDDGDSGGIHESKAGKVHDALSRHMFLDQLADRTDRTARLMMIELAGEVNSERSGGKGGRYLHCDLTSL